MSKLYYLDEDQLGVITRVKRRLYNEMERLSADDRRDLANALDAVTHSVETYGEVTEPDRNNEVTKRDG